MKRAPRLVESRRGEVFVTPPPPRKGIVMIRRLGLLLLAACDGLLRAECGGRTSSPDSRNGIPLRLFAANGSSLTDGNGKRAWGNPSN